MYNGTDRYYSEHITGSYGKYKVIDRQTGETLQEFDSWQKAEVEVKRLMKKERGIVNDDNIEIPYSYYPVRNREPMEVGSVTVHK